MYDVGTLAKSFDRELILTSADFEIIQVDPAFKLKVRCFVKNLLRVAEPIDALREFCRIPQKLLARLCVWGPASTPP
jgi:hypothetical protein